MGPNKGLLIRRVVTATMCILNLVAKILVCFGSGCHSYAVETMESHGGNYFSDEQISPLRYDFVLNAIRF